MTSIEEAQSWIGRTALDSTGEQFGIITQIWVDDASGQAEWASVKGPALRRREALVPLAGNGAFGSGRRFAYTKEEIVDSPDGAENGLLPVADKERLSAYYGDPVPDQDPGPETWVGRMEDAADGATVREITALLGGAPSPAPEDPATGKVSRRRRRKPASSESKAKRLFRRSASTTEEQPAELSPLADEVGFRH